MLWREISTGRWLRAIYSSCHNYAKFYHKELVDSRSRQPPSWNAPTLSAETHLKYSTNFTHEDILETTYGKPQWGFWWELWRAGIALEEITGSTKPTKNPRRMLLIWVGASGDSCPEPTCIMRDSQGRAEGIYRCHSFLSLQEKKTSVCYLRIHTSSARAVTVRWEV